ncbi:hypothetical protein [Sporosarcina sp. P25]|nr:hypothetical protein [Sporosarcina sp. P25]
MFYYGNELNPKLSNLVDIGCSLSESEKARYRPAKLLYEMH